MNCNKPIKSVSPKIKRDRIYILEKKSEFARLIIQNNSEDELEERIINFILSNSNPSDVLLKAFNGHDEEGEITWDYYFGKCDNNNLIITIKEYHNVIFHDGFNQFMIRNTETFEYICFDDHGILFYYDFSENIFNKIIKELNNYKKVRNYKEFIMGAGHWHYRYKDAEEDLNKFIKKLNLIR
jgi:hypothetical protein